MCYDLWLFDSLSVRVLPHQPARTPFARMSAWAEVPGVLFMERRLSVYTFEFVILRWLTSGI